jgi:hypothetical protein
MTTQQRLRELVDQLCDSMRHRQRPAEPPDEDQAHRDPGTAARGLPAGADAHRWAPGAMPSRVGDQVRLELRGPAQ